MCHFGNPFFESAAAVLVKNPNVAADISGFLDGRTDLDGYFEEQAGYVFLLKTWLTACNSWDRLMFGTDFPIVNLGEYIEFIKRIVPEQYWRQVFYRNANWIYGLHI
jgi:predicted TIM-barrel fold metal-dependent hydrolase